MSVKDAQELLALQASLLQPAAEKAAAYSRHLYDIAAAHQRRSDQGRRSPDRPTRRRSSSAWSTPPSKNAPAGSENAVALVKSAVAAANNAFESVQKAAKQAADVAEANFQAVTNTAVKATQAATKAQARA